MPITITPGPAVPSGGTPRGALPKAGALAAFHVPGVDPEDTALTVADVQADRLYYQPIQTGGRISYTSFRVVVAEAFGGPRLARFGVYAADASAQPTGALLADWGERTFTTNGIYTFTIPAFATAGDFVIAWTANQFMNWSGLKGATLAGLHPTGGGSLYVGSLYVARAYAALPATAVPWDTMVQQFNPFINLVLLG